MDQGYESFCMVDPIFYDAMRSIDTAGPSFPTAARRLPAGWRCGEQDDWLTYDPPESVLPEQGWKIHVSACLGNAEKVLDTVWQYCVTQRVTFKFLRSPAALLARVSKYAPRGYSGKLITIYPVDEPHCKRILIDLGASLEGEPSPYILTDLRWGSGPLYVRYGAFAMRYCTGPDGQLVPAIADPEGDLVPDGREPVFRPPDWVRTPEFLRPHLEARNAITVDEIPYTITRVLHFSNGGGIYVARDTAAGRDVVLKEGRPHSGLDARGDDAVRRIEREHRILRRLAGVPGVPEVHDTFFLGEHRFLAMEYIDAIPLNKAIVQRYPMIDPAATHAEFMSYTEWAVDIYRQIETTIEGIHRRGIVYGDLHLFNVMITEDGGIVLLDYEVAAPVEEADTPGLGNQGFAPPPGTKGFRIDEYALACLRLALFLPMTGLLWLDRAKAQEFARIIADHFPVPNGYLDPSIDVLAPGTVGRPDRELTTISPDRHEWPELRGRLTRSILASATPERSDRLFPGDIEQFAVGGLGLAYGAAGVLYALSVTGAGRFPEHEEWFVEQVRKPPNGTRPGLYDGLHGAAFTLEHLGYRQDALDVVDLCLRSDWETLPLDLAGGLAGIGRSLQHFAEIEPSLATTADRTAQLVADRIGDRPPGEVSGGGNPSAGLLRGMAGPALFLIHAYDRSGDSGYLDRAAEALRQDLRRCVTRDSGALEVNEGWRTMPYLDVGSVGIGMVLDEYLARRADDQFAEASAGVLRAASSTLYILPGLFSGRAGILLYLAGRRIGAPGESVDLTTQIRALSWHALPYAEGTAFPGTALLRLSMDLATGTAGVLLALGAVLHDEPVHLPLLRPTNPRAERHG